MTRSSSRTLISGTSASIGCSSVWQGPLERNLRLGRLHDGLASVPWTLDGAWTCNGLTAEMDCHGPHAYKFRRSAPAPTNNAVDAYSAGALRVKDCTRSSGGIDLVWVLATVCLTRQSVAASEPFAGTYKRVCHGACEGHAPRQPRMRFNSHDSGPTFAYAAS